MIDFISGYLSFQEMFQERQTDYEALYGIYVEKVMKPFYKEVVNFPHCEGRWVAPLFD